MTAEGNSFDARHSFNEFNTLAIIYGYDCSKNVSDENESESLTKQNSDRKFPAGVIEESMHSWSLLKMCTFSKSTFQTEWSKLPTSSVVKLHLSGRTNWTIEKVEALFRKSLIFTLASGCPQGNMKCFMYCVDTQDAFFLLELHTKKKDLVEVTIKASSSDNLDEFEAHLKHVVASM
jgi:hypothetical protein